MFEALERRECKTSAKKLCKDLREIGQSTVMEEEISSMEDHIMGKRIFALDTKLEPRENPEVSVKFLCQESMIL